MPASKPDTTTTEPPALETPRFAEHRHDPADRRITALAYSERDAAAAIATGQADVGPGVRAASIAAVWPSASGNCAGWCLG